MLKPLHDYLQTVSEVKIVIFLMMWFVLSASFFYFKWMQAKERKDSNQRIFSKVYFWICVIGFVLMFVAFGSKFGVF